MGRGGPPVPCRAGGRRIGRPADGGSGRARVWLDRGLHLTQPDTASTVVTTATDRCAAVTRTRRSTSMDLHSTTTVTRPVEEVYGFWSRLDQLPTFMAHLD